MAAELENLNEVIRDWPTMSMPEKKRVWLDLTGWSEDRFDDMMKKQKARQSGVPQPGSQAPDFEIDMLDRARRRTGETVRLSSLRGKPVGLIFGSYT